MEPEAAGCKNRAIDFIHEIGSRMADSGGFAEVLARIVDFVCNLIHCDSCFIYVLEDDELVLRASKNPHPDAVNRLKLRIGQGITGWVAENRTPVAVPRNASQDPRFRFFSELPEDAYEAFLSVPVLCRGRVVGVINVQHRLPHLHTRTEVKLISTIGFLVGSEIELARLEDKVSDLSGQLESRKLVERAKGVLQRELKISEEEAYRTLQRQSRQRRKPMKEIAEAILLSDEVRSPRSSGGLPARPKTS